jgi:hypothetical protein
VTPTVKQPEVLPSPQSNRYRTSLPRLEVAPPVELVPTAPLAGPVGAVGVEIVSPADTVTMRAGEAAEIAWVSTVHRAFAVTEKVPGPGQEWKGHQASGNVFTGAFS